MESGASVTIADAMKYLSMDMKIAPEETESENIDDADKSEGEEEKLDDDPNLPKVRIPYASDKIYAYKHFSAVNVSGVLGKASISL